MSHQSQLDFVASLKLKYPEYFDGRKVLEIGSLDINGSIRQFFTDCDYVGVDIGPGAGVDVVAHGEDLVYPSSYFDAVVSCECFEHNPEWLKTFENMVRMAKGLVFFTCATTGRPEHGTTRTSPADAPYCGDYYRNLVVGDFMNSPWLAKFEKYQFSYNENPADLYFYGICKQS